MMFPIDFHVKSITIQADDGEYEVDKTNLKKFIHNLHTAEQMYFQRTGWFTKVKWMKKSLTKEKKPRYTSR